MKQPVVYLIGSSPCAASVGGSRREASTGLIQRMSWQPCAPSVGANASERPCVTRSALLSEVAPAWLLEHMDPAWAERYEKRFSDFRLPKEEKKRTELAETIGADGRRLFEQVCAESRLPWVRELEAIDTLRRVWMQHSHASSPSAPRGVRMESCHPQRC